MQRLVYERLRLGLGPSIVIASLERAVRPSAIVRWGLSVHAGLRVDVLRTSSVSMFALADVDAGFTGT